MKIICTHTLRGPNIWSRRTVLEALVDLEELADSPSNTLPGLYERLTSWLPSLIEHRCGLGVRGGFLERLRDGTYAGHILEHLTIELQNLAGTPVGFGKARETSAPGVYKVAMRYRDEQVGMACLSAAFELLQAAIAGQPFDIPGTVARLRELADNVCLGPSSRSIIEAAEARNIPVMRLSSGSLVQLGYGCKQRRIWTAETDQTSAIAESIASDKQLTRQLLSECGVPVPRGAPAESAESAWDIALELGLPVVVKPRDGNHGRGVFTELSTQAEIQAAFAVAANEGSGVIIERFIRGNEHRLLVVGGHMVAAARGETAWVEGDGENTVNQLIAQQLNSNPRRGHSDAFPLNPVELDDVSVMELKRQGLTPESIPALGLKVLVQRNGNVAYDVTDEVHPSVAAHVVLASKIVGLDIAGIDLVAEDISRPLEEQGGALVEVNAGPALHMHLTPAEGKPRPVGEAIVDTIFPAGTDGRIPIACVAGTAGKSVVASLLSHLLSSTGRKTGLASSDGTFLDARLLHRGNGAVSARARQILQNPETEAAVFEAGVEGVLTEGLGVDRCDVAVVTGIGQGDHLGPHDVLTPDALFAVERCAVDVVRATGAAVLKADDPLVCKMAELSDGAVIFFAQDPTHPVLVARQLAGQRVVTLCEGKIVVAEGSVQTELLAVQELPWAWQGRAPQLVESALAAVGAAWSLGIAADAIRDGLRSFGDSKHRARGRCEVVLSGPVTVIVDNCQSADAFSGLRQALATLPKGQRIAVCAAVLRRDQDIDLQGERFAAEFDELVIFPRSGPSSGPSSGPREDMSQLAQRDRLCQAVSAAPHAPSIRVVATAREAVDLALQAAQPGAVVVIQADEAHPGSTVELVKTALLAHNAQAKV